MITDTENIVAVARGRVWEIREIDEVGKGKKEKEKKRNLILRNLFETTALWLILMNIK